MTDEDCLLSCTRPVRVEVDRFCEAEKCFLNWSIAHFTNRQQWWKLSFRRWTWECNIHFAMTKDLSTSLILLECTPFTLVCLKRMNQLTQKRRGYWWGKLNIILKIFFYLLLSKEDATSCLCVSSFFKVRAQLKIVWFTTPHKSLCRKLRTILYRFHNVYRFPARRFYVELRSKVQCNGFCLIYQAKVCKVGIWPSTTIIYRFYRFSFSNYCLYFFSVRTRHY